MAYSTPLIYFKTILSIKWTLSISKRNGEDPSPQQRSCTNSPPRATNMLEWLEWSKTNKPLNVSMPMLESMAWYLTKPKIGIHKEHAWRNTEVLMHGLAEFFNFLVNKSLALFLRIFNLYFQNLMQLQSCIRGKT